MCCFPTASSIMFHLTHFDLEVNWVSDSSGTGMLIPLKPAKVAKPCGLTRPGCGNPQLWWFGGSLVQSVSPVKKSRDDTNLKKKLSTFFMKDRVRSSAWFILRFRTKCIQMSSIVVECNPLIFHTCHQRLSLAYYLQNHSCWWALGLDMVGHVNE